MVSVSTEGLDREYTHKLIVCCHSGTFLVNVTLWRFIELIRHRRSENKRTSYKQTCICLPPGQDNRLDWKVIAHFTATGRPQYTHTQH